MVVSIWEGPVESHFGELHSQNAWLALFFKHRAAMVIAAMSADSMGKFIVAAIGAGSQVDGLEPIV
jgi:hypothetical protein